jgi:hypothetical protein
MAEFATMESNGFPYGINWAKPPEALDAGELVQAENCEYDYADGALRTCAGITIQLDLGSRIDTLFYDNRHNVFYFSAGVFLYVTPDLKNYTKLGQLNGTNKPVYTMYGDICLLASGALLQSISGGSTLQQVSGSPVRNDYVTVRQGRVLTYAGNSDQLSYSAVGDYTSWANNPRDTSSAQFVNVGYKDPGNIVSVDFLNKVIMVYKEGGRAYKIVGEPQDSDYAVQPVSQTAYCGSERATCNIDNKSYYVGAAGMMSFVPTNAYGDIQPFEEGLNINAWVVKNLDANCEMWHVPSRKQIWLKTQNDKRVYMYHYVPRYSDGRGAFTVRTMAYDLHDVCCVGDRVYVAYGNKIGVLDESTDKDDTVQIQTAITGQNRLATKHSILVMNRLFVSYNLIAGCGTIKCGKKTKNLTFLADSPFIYSDTDTIYGNENYIYADAYTRAYKVGGGSNKNVQVEIFVQGGAISLREFMYQYLEV